MYDRSRDLHDLGIALAQMLFGLEVYYTFASPAALLSSCQWSRRCYRESSGADRGRFVVPDGFSPPALLALTELLTKKTLPAATDLLCQLQKLTRPTPATIESQWPSSQLLRTQALTSSSRRSTTVDDVPRCEPSSSTDDSGACGGWTARILLAAADRTAGVTVSG